MGEKQPIRIAQIMGKLAMGGVESVVYNYYRHIDKTKIQFDFFYDADSEVSPPKELINLGARFIKVSPYQNIFSFIKDLTFHCKKNHYPILHTHLNTLSIFPLFAAWRAGVPVRIAHSHSTAGRGEFGRNVLKYILRPLVKLFATDYFACSKYAGEWLFGRRAVAQHKVFILHNAIDIEKYSFDKTLRTKTRQELGIADKFVVGHIGRFMYQKNHSFLIDIFADLYANNRNAILLLIGDGPLLNKIKNKVQARGLEQAVIFLGTRKDAYKLYSALDVFVLPSWYEGLAVVAVEAQANGLPCLFSEYVARETKLLPNAQFLSISHSTLNWTKAIAKASRCQSKQTINAAFEKKGLSITAAAKLLPQYYVSKLKI